MGTSCYETGDDSKKVTDGVEKPLTYGDSPSEYRFCICHSCY